MSIGHSPNTEPHKPDMKKDESKVTLEERHEARRRIEGSIAPDSDLGPLYPGAPEGGDGISYLNPADIH